MSNKYILSYLIPTLIGYVLIATKLIFDGIFVSYKFGPEGVAALSLVQPFIIAGNAFVIALGIGTCTYVGISIGKNNTKEVSQRFTMFLVVSIIIAFFVSVILLVVSNFYLMELYTGDESIALLAQQYITVYMLGFIFYSFVIILGFCVRVDGNPMQMMRVEIIGTIVNVILNFTFLFILDLSIGFVAFATVLAWCTQISIHIVYYLKYSNIIKFSKFKFEFSLIKEALINGSSDGLLELSNAMRIFIYNGLLLFFIGGVGVAMMGYINYISIFMYMVIYALCDTLNPLISRSLGREEYEIIKITRRKFIKLAFLISIGCYMFLFLFEEYIYKLFGVPEGEMFEVLLVITLVHLSALIFVGFNQLMTSYFTSINRGGISLFYSLIRNFVIFFLVLIIIVPLLGEKGIWLILPLTEFLSFILMIVIYKFKGELNKENARII